jgi:hypothetical protein
MSDAKPASGAKASGAAQSAAVVADLGSRSKKSIKKLRQGDGRLLEDVHKLVNQLKADHTVGDNAQAVIVVVKEKRRGSGMFL